MSATNGTATTVKYSLAMIVRNCAKELETALKSFAAYPDEIVVVNTGIDENEPGFAETNKVAESFGAKVYHFPWVEDFSAARNFSFSKCSHDIVMWLDTDDIVDNPRGLNQSIRRSFADGGAEILYVEYLYEFDERGNCTTVLTRERVVDRRNFEWRAPIHEVLCENFHSRGHQLPPQLGRIKHNRKRGDKEQQISLERNLRVIEHHFLPVDKGGKGEYCEERMVFYWANTLMGLKRYEEALRKYLEYVPRSGSQAEVQQALGNASECCRLIGRYPEAKALAYQAIERNPNAPTPYWFLAQANLSSGNDELALNFAMSCLERGDKLQQEMVANPTVIFGGAALMAATINYRLNRADKVEPLLNIAAKYFGENEVGIKEMRQNLAIHKETSRIVEAYATLYRSALDEGRHEDLKRLAQAAPALIKERHEVARHLPKVRPEGKRSIAFFCGGGMSGGWSPKLLETGMGGSEEAVCYLSELFVKAGWHVEVYAPCGDRRAWNGVEWYPVEYFSGEDDGGVDVLIVWRNPMNLLDFGVKAKRTYLWLHDMPNMGMWMPGIWNGFDGVFVLSEFHKEVYGFIPSEKLIVSANGIPVEKLPPVESLANEPLRMVYASDPARGLETVLNWWEFIRSKVPDAKLDIFYGFHPTFEEAARHRTPHGRALTELKKRIIEKAKQPGITWHGFVGHKQLHESFAKTGLWLYPTQFPEISPCRGDTLIETLDGAKRIDSLVGQKDFKVYSCDSARKLNVSNVGGVFLTRKNAPMVKLTMRPGLGRNAKKETTLYCTPDHEIMLRDGSYKPAGELRVGDRVKAFHNQKNGWQKGYATIGVTGEAVVPAHRFVAEKCLRPLVDGEVVHHRNGDTTDNLPENLEITTQSAHRAGHCAEMTQEERHDFAVMTQQKAKSRLGAAYGQMKRDAANARWSRHRASNHVIMAVEDGGTADAFCMTVEPDHNFVANGIFVHNCITAMKIQSLGCFPVTVDDFALSETVKYGEKVPLKLDAPENQAVWAQKVVDYALNPPSQEKRNDMALLSRVMFDWSGVCDQWVAQFEADLAKDGGERFYPRNRMDLIRAS